MDEIFLIIQKIQKLRKGVPQFLFYDSVSQPQVIAVRQGVGDYKTEHPNCEEIDVIINSPGGFADDAYRIIRTFRKNFKTVNIIVPFWVKSAATLLSLGGSTIVMDEFGEFGPLDAQLGRVRDDSPEIERESALNDEHSLKRIETRYKEMFETLFIRLFEHKKINIPKSELSKQLLENLSKFYEPLLKQVDPYKLGEKRRKLDIGAHYANRILAQFSDLTDSAAIRKLVLYLVDECPDHGYVIDHDLIAIFLNNVLTTKQFKGEKYAKLISELSFLFMKEEIPFEFIGFINPVDEDKVEDIGEGETTATGIDEIAIDKPLKKTNKTHYFKETRNQSPLNYVL